MIKNILLATSLITLALLYGMRGTHHECPKQNEIVNGCVMQKSGDNWIRTCG